MSDRGYSRIDKRPDETNWEFCQRAARSIPPEAILKQLILYLDERHERSQKSKRHRRSEAWVVLMDITGHGSGFSNAICELYRNWEPAAPKKCEAAQDS